MHGNGATKHESSRGAQEVRQKCWSPHKSSKKLHTTTFIGFETLKEVWYFACRYQTRCK